ncbi:Ribonuclease/ribotoxin [Podospora conica]|nr:Ribonuclease/ribotoxin [Schizothecium conicum]
MQLLLLTTALAALATAQSVTGTSSLTSVTCGSTRYTAQQILDATTEGCRLHAAGQQLGNNNYPHQFNNREALVFAASGPYQEFPVIAGGAVYAGRSPGADRIVFKPGSSRCEYVGSMTHTGAPTNNGFVLCEEVKGRSTSAAGTSVTRTTSSTRTATADASSAASTSGSAASGMGVGIQGWVMGAVGLMAPLMVAV